MEKELEYLKHNIKHYRNLKKISQQELAEKSGFSTSFIADLELGRRQPSLKSLVNISDALEIEAYQLLINPNNHKYEAIDNFSKDLGNAISEIIEDYRKRY